MAADKRKSGFFEDKRSPEVDSLEEELPQEAGPLDLPAARGTNTVFEIPHVPTMPAKTWARGRREALVHIFVTDVARERIDKRSAADWDAAFAAWLALPR